MSFTFAHMCEVTLLEAEARYKAVAGRSGRGAASGAQWMRFTHRRKEKRGMDVERSWSSTHPALAL